VFVDICVDCHRRQLMLLPTGSRFGTGSEAREKGFRHSTKAVHAWSTNRLSLQFSAF
jgi:hypothetical protein